MAYSDLHVLASIFCAVSMCTNFTSSNCIGVGSRDAPGVGAPLVAEELTSLI